MNTRKHPRTLVEAFGPYAHGNQIVEPDRPFDWQDVVVMAGCALTFVGWILVMVL